MQKQAIKACVESICGGFRMISQRFDNEYTDFLDKISKIHPQVVLQFGGKIDLKP